MTRRLRILHIVQNLNYGGMERIITELANRTDKSKFDVHVMTLQYKGHFSEYMDSAVSVHLAKRGSRFSMLCPISLTSSILAVKPDIVHSHSGVWYKASLASRMASIPCIIHTDHGRQKPDPWIHRTLDARASRRTDIVVAVSDALASRIRTFISPKSELCVIRNGVDTDFYKPTPGNGFLHREFGLDISRPLIGSVGRLEAIKGYDVMVEGFRILLKSWPNDIKPALVLIGDGSERDKLRNMIDQHGLSSDIILSGWRSDIDKALYEFSLFSMSSHSEGTSVSLLEAMSSGLCPVVTDVGGNAAVMGPELAHRIVPPSNPERLAEGWIEALNNSGKLLEDASVARIRVESDFSLSSMVRQYEQLYDSASAV